MSVEKIENVLLGRTSLIYLISEEEERVERLIEAAINKVWSNPVRTYSWSCVEGLCSKDGVIDASCDPVAGLEGFLSVKEQAVLIFKDIHLLLNGNPRLIRQLKECARVLGPTTNKVFFLAPVRALPEELIPLFKVDEIPLPGYQELVAILERAIEEQEAAASLKESLSADLRNKMVRAAQGFTATEAANAFHIALRGARAITGKTVDQVLEEKQTLVQQSGVIEFVSRKAGSWEIGGLLNLKKWLNERGQAFSPQAARKGLTPRGILVMGVSGCGKSLCIKAIANYWKLPLLRLDMGRVYDGLAGPPEEAMRKAIKTAEAVAPCVLWIDEIEAGIANQKQKAGGGPEARVLALFLTWLQEKTAPVFVGATANEVEVLPPEILRKGRFDELFFMGLPLRDERKQILTIHMRKRGVDPARFDMDYLAESTDGLNGAEIEQGVISAIFEAASAKQELSEHVLANALRNIVPLSRTMRERIQKIEAWARDRAMKASLQTL
ncbi:MAG: AAA family ATPase [Thermodesulfobacteriota bacterium]